MSACGKQSFSSESNLSETEISVNGESNKIEINETSEVEQFGASFLDPFVDGKLIYTIQSCNIYETLEEAKIEENVLIEPHSTYFSQDIGEQYQTISDFINEDGSIVDTHQLVVLEMQVKNEDAIGIIKKNEFNISNISIRGGENVSQYNVA
ncbi:MAG TPA: hypothetical protein IAC41_04400, partial [Candidatus Merdenecus merdavium]|nr:hypothetical protein [Candidatus Merdenecus merdavium]